MFTTTQKLNSTCHSQPRNTILMTCENNFMPLSWHMPISKEPFRYAIAVRDENSSYDMLHLHQEFALNFLDISYLEAFEISGRVHGKDEDKFALTKLTPKKAHKIKSTLLEEAYMIYECKIVEVLNFGDHDIFVADVVLIHNKEGVEVAPTLFLGKGYYDTTTKNLQRIER